MQENMIGFCRAKRLDNNEWVEGCYCKHDTVKVILSSDDPKTKHLIIVDGFCDWGFEPPLQGIEVDPDTVCLCSFVRDKNDCTLFAGDIVKAYNTDDLCFILRFGKYDKAVGQAYYCGVGFYLERVGNPSFIQPLGMISPAELEKIGTIHD